MGNKTASSKISARVTWFISNNDNRYITRVSDIVYMYVYNSIKGVAKQIRKVVKI